MSVAALRVASELRGTVCFPLSTKIDPKQSIACSRSFGKPVSSPQELLEAVASYASRAAVKLRKGKLLASSVFVYLVQHPATKGTKTARFVLRESTDYTPDLIKGAKQAVNALIQRGRVYKKVGVVMEGLIPNNAFQKDLFGPGVQESKRRNEAMQLVDMINKKLGSDTLIFAAEGVEKKWSMRQNFRTLRFTTRWEEILKIRV